MARKRAKIREPIQKDCMYIKHSNLACHRCHQKTKETWITCTGVMSCETCYYNRMNMVTKHPTCRLKPKDLITIPDLNYCCMEWHGK